LSAAWPSGSNAISENFGEAFSDDGQYSSGPIIDQNQERHKTILYTNQLGMQFVFIPHGKLLMGSPSNEIGRTIFETQVDIVIEKPFYMQTTEVTQKQWKEVMGENPSYFLDCGYNCPVENISWEDVQRFIIELQHIDSSSLYRLPTEAEWEYACRSGNSMPFSNDAIVDVQCHEENPLNTIAWYNCNAKNKTHPVGQKLTNDWGLHDMHGNVYEWCQNVYAANYADALNGNLSDADPIAARAVRSCSYNDTAVSCRSAARSNFRPNIKSHAIGFRLVREPVYYKIKLPPDGINLKIATNKSKKDFTKVSPQEASPTEPIAKNQLYSLQIAATKDAGQADFLLSKLRNRGYDAFKIMVKLPEKGTWYRIRIGKFRSIEAARREQKKLAEDNIKGIVVKNT